MTSTTLRARKSELSKISYRSHHGSNGGQPEGDPRAQSGSFLPLFWLCQKPRLQIRKKTLRKSNVQVLSLFNFMTLFSTTLAMSHPGSSWVQAGGSVGEDRGLDRPQSLA
jgi:hypothetical protein